jgi:hypothetical protein
VITITGVAGLATNVWANGDSAGQKLAGGVLGLGAILCLSIGLLAVVFLFSLMRTPTVRRGSIRMSAAPGRCLLIGLLVLVVGLGGFAVLKPLGPAGALPGLLLALALVWCMVSGLSMVAHQIGERIQTAWLSRSLGSDPMAVLYGMILLLAVGFLPVIGQLVQLVALLVGLGSAVSGPFEKSARTPPVPAQPTPPAS